MTTAGIDSMVLAGIDKIDAGFAIFDERLCLVFCNARYPEIRGYPPALCQPGTALADLFRFNAVRGDYGPGDADDHAARRIEQIRTSLPIEADQVLSDGRVLLSRYKPMAGGGLAATYEDVTELRRAAAALRNDRMRYGLVAEAVSEGIYDWDIELNRLEVSDRLNRIFDFDEGELTAADWVARVHPDDVPTYSSALRRHFRAHTPVLATAYRIRDKTGGFRWVEDHGKAIRNPAGRAVRLVGAIADITDRKESERALQESEERYALAMNAINEGVYDFDLVSNRVFYSPNVHKTLGFTPEEMATAQDWLDHIHPEDLPRYRTAMADLLRGRTPRLVCEVRYSHSDGTLHWARQHGTAVRDADGRAIRVVGSTGDITAEKALEQELEKARMRLSESLESIAQGFALFDADDRLVMSNAPYRRLFGGDLDPDLGRMVVPGMKFEDYIRAAHAKGMYPNAGADLETFVQARLRRRNTGGTFELMLRDGTWLAVTERRTHEGGLVALYADITEVKSREAELQAARDRAEAALGRASDGQGSPGPDREARLARPAYGGHRPRDQESPELRQQLRDAVG
jgi:PAS domain S-box-containing protein